MSKSGRDGRLRTKVKTAKGRKISSTRWLERQLNDPYVAQAQKEGYRSRAAYKLIEIDNKYKLLKPGQCVVDLGCAPGGWTQVAVERTKSDRNSGAYVIGIDIQDVDIIAGAEILKMDFMDDAAPDEICNLASRSPDLVLSDMAAAVTGHKNTDHLRTIALAEAAAYFAIENLAPDGAFCAKVFQGGTEADLLSELKKNFMRVIHVKPKASRKESSELYVIALGFKPND
ncbi:MAG: RlmE family RNA methyltransferase [Pseudomonadota bacterium]|nr:RlmE family RNA methyltransferase [Pseudomonadota bacterium]